MKTAIKKTICFLLALIMVSGMFAIESSAAISDKRSNISGYKIANYPRFPELELKQQYYIIYKESFRSDRTEICFFDISDAGEMMHLQWKGKKKPIDIIYGEIANDEKYYLSNGKWVKFETGWGSISSGATKILDSNLNVYNEKGNRCLKATPIQYLYFDQDIYTCDKGDIFSIKAKTNLGTLTYKSSNKYVVSINSKGKIKALKSGTVTITAKAKNGKIATCKVKVKK